jgi:hypothetical protein
MTTLPNVDPAPDDAEETELMYCVPSVGPRRRTFGSLWRNVHGRSAAALRAFYGATPIAQPANANQAAVSSTVGAVVATTGATQTTPFGFTTATQANDLVSRVNQLRADVLELTRLVNQIRADLVALGLQKGSA